jgi:hypothetical protein
MVFDDISTAWLRFERWSSRGHILNILGSRSSNKHDLNTSTIPGLFFQLRNFQPLENIQRRHGISLIDKKWRKGAHGNSPCFIMCPRAMPIGPHANIFFLLHPDRPNFDSTQPCLSCMSWDQTGCSLRRLYAGWHIKRVDKLPLDLRGLSTQLLLHFDTDSLIATRSSPFE